MTPGVIDRRARGGGILFRGKGVQINREGPAGEVVRVFEDRFRFVVAKEAGSQGSPRKGD